MEERKEGGSPEMGSLGVPQWWNTDMQIPKLISLTQTQPFQQRTVALRHCDLALWPSQPTLPSLMSLEEVFRGC
jgi:hypothetical protein